MRKWERGRRGVEKERYRNDDGGDAAEG